MKKLFTFLAGAALLGSLSACSSDEPAKDPNKGSNGDRSAMYMAVRIGSVDNLSRAGSEFEETDPKEGSYVKGDEHAVKSADFFFFDANGIYVAQGNIWKDGTENTTDENIEYDSNVVVMLKGQKSMTILPKYVITVLNAPTDFAAEMLVNVSTMADFSKKEMDYLSDIKAEGSDDKYFVMSTSSFYIEDATSIFYDDNVPFANRIPDGYLKEEPIDVTDTNLNVLDIYVERLASKYSLDAASREFPLTIQLAGSGNIEGEDNVEEGTTSDNTPSTLVTIKITGLGISNTESTSYLSKDISGFTPAGFGNWVWNNKDYHRSFWGKSKHYNSTDATGLKLAKFADGVTLANNVFVPVYSNETTKALANIQGEGNSLKADLLPIFYITAEARIKDETKTLVEYNSMYFYEEQFKKYLLSRLANRTQGFNYWLRTDAKQGEATTEDGKTIVINNYKYTQVGPDNIAAVRQDPTVKNSKVKYVFTYDKELAAPDIYQKVDDGFEVMDGGIAALDTDLVSIFTNASLYPEYFNGGKMYYRIPVEHLLGTNKVAPNITAEKEGEYGTVRNHWYQLSVDKIATMGTGVFDPSNGEDGDEIYPDPDPNKQTYGMAARIKILSWKIVKQHVSF